MSVLAERSRSSRQIRGLLQVNVTEQKGRSENLFPYLPVDTSRPVNQVAEFSSLVFGLKEKGQFSARVTRVPCAT